MDTGEEVLGLRLILEVWMLDESADGWKRLEEWISGCMLSGWRHPTNNWISRVGEWRGLEAGKEWYRAWCDLGHPSSRREACGEGPRGW